MTEEINLSNAAHLRGFYDTEKMRNNADVRDAANESESISDDESAGCYGQDLIELLREDRKRKHVDISDDNDTADDNDDETAGAGATTHISLAVIQSQLERADNERLGKLAMGDVFSYKSALQTLSAALQDAEPSKSAADVRRQASAQIDAIIDERRAAERDELCERVTKRSYRQACQFVEESMRKAASLDTDETIAVKARKKIDALIEPERRKLLLACPLTATLLGTLEEETRRQKAVPNEELSRVFKRWVGVDSGGALRELDAEIRRSHPKLSAREVADKAQAELRKIQRNCRLIWQMHVADNQMSDMLERDASPEALAIMRRYRHTLAKLESRTDAELALRESDIAVEDKSREMYEQQRRDYAEDARRTLGGGGAASTSLMRIDDARQPTDVVAVREETESGSVVNRNHYGEPIESGVHAMAHFLTAYTTNKSRSEATHRGELMEQLDRDIALSLTQHVQMLSVMPEDADFTPLGEKSTGNAIEDLRRLLRSSGVKQKFSHKTLLAYQRHFRANYKETSVDIDRALVVKYHQFDKQRVTKVMSEMLVPEDQCEASMAYGVAPEDNAILRAVMAAAMSDHFRRTQRQAADETNLAARRAKAERESARREEAAGQPAKRRRKEKHGNIVIKSLADSPLDKVAEPSLVVKMEKCSRAYLQSYMRQPLGDEHGERECALGNRCICLVTAANYPEMVKTHRKGSGFICMEFLLPSEKRAWDVHEQLPKWRKLCIICTRAVVTSRLQESIKNGVEPELPLHDHSVFIDVPGEYDSRVCLNPTVGQGKMTGIVAPFVGYNAADYTYGEVETESRTVLGLLESNRLDFRLRSGQDPRI